MKKIMIMAIAIIGFLSTIEAQDLDVVVGTNLNIGSDNTINPESNCGNAIGENNEINSNNSIAVGNGNITSLNSPCSAVFGSSNHLSGMGGFIAGYQNTTASSLGMAFGKRLKVTGSESILFGSGIESLHLELINDENSSFMVGFNSTKPTLFVAGARNVGQNTELTGRIAIGDVPYAELSAKLHIRSDEGEDAGIILEPKQPEANGTFIRLRDQNHSMEVDNQGAMTLNSGNTLALSAIDKLSLSSDDIIEIGGTGQNISLSDRVAIGDITPAAKLHILSDEGEEAGIILEPKQPETNGTFIWMHDENHSLTVGTNGEMCINSGAASNKLPLTLNGKVGINTTNDFTNYRYALTVDGGILTDRVLIRSVDEWYDAVFADSYRLMPLNELKDFVSTHHHLPEVPAENEVVEQGYDMSEMQGILLKKIEELTLYTIKQEEEIEALRKEINELKAK